MSTPAPETHVDMDYGESTSTFKYPEWVDAALEIEKNPKMLETEDMEWNWELDFNVHSPEGADTTREERERIFLEATAFPYWPNDSFRTLHDILAPYDRPNGVYILDGYDDYARKIYAVCERLAMALQKIYGYTVIHMNPSFIDGPYRFAYEYHRSGVDIFRNCLRRIARPIYWVNLPEELQRELTNLCTGMIQQLQTTKPIQYTSSRYYKDLYKQVTRFGCTIL